MANTYLRRTPSSTGTPTKMTYSTWIKKTKIGTGQSILGAALTSDASNYKCSLYFNSNDRIQFEQYGTGLHFNYQTNAKYRDTNGWYHFVLQYDSTNVTAGDRIKMYVNGEEITSWATESDPASDQVCYLGSTNNYYTDIGDSVDYGYFNGYMAQSVFIDGTALPASTFGEVDSTTGEWSPKGDSQIRSGVTFGTNGFLLTYENASYLGYDYQTAARSTTNDFTVSGSGYQSLDCPSNVFLNWNVVWNSWAYESAGGGGSSGVPSISYAGTQLNYTSGAYTSCLGTLATSSMKYYFEMEVTGTEPIFGVMAARPAGNASQTYNDTTCNGFYPQDGQKIVNGVFSAGGTGFTGTGYYMVAVDPAGGKMWVGKAGTWNGNPSTNTSPLITGMTSTLNNETCEYTPWGNIGDTSTTVIKCNFGLGYFAATSAGATNADANGEGVFKYTVPTGFYCLNYKNLKTQNG